MPIRARFLREICVVNPLSAEEKIDKFGTTLGALELAIQQSLNDGWKLHGSMSITPMKHDEPYPHTTYIFTQLVTKEVYDISESWSTSSDVAVASHS